MRPTGAVVLVRSDALWLTGRQHAEQKRHARSLPPPGTAARALTRSPLPPTACRHCRRSLSHTAGEACHSAQQATAAMVFWDNKDAHIIAGLCAYTALAISIAQASRSVRWR